MLAWLRRVPGDRVAVALTAIEYLNIWNGMSRRGNTASIEPQEKEIAENRKNLKKEGENIVGAFVLLLFIGGPGVPYRSQ